MSRSAGETVTGATLQRHLGAGGVVFTLELEAVGRLQQPFAVIQHQLADLGQATLIGAAFKKFDA